MTQKKQRKKKKKFFFSPKFFFLTLKILEILKISKFALKILDFWPFLGGFFRAKNFQSQKKIFSEKKKKIFFFFFFRLRTRPHIGFRRHTSRMYYEISGN